ncbi:SDR family NAD(P)-dependent oxidoreductase [Castellaniella sp.]|uniref:SDR family NAD(P)-dependent oxidoreductase n=1 Tax=Castellaniella sp. TaxID=1955812 RepID=UPI0035619E00
MIDFHGKTAVITGAAGGIGHATAQRLHAAGANVMLCDLSQAALEAMVKTFPANTFPADAAERVSLHAADISDSAACQRLFEAVAQRYGTVDYLVNAAGLYPAQPVASMTDAQWRALMAVNLDGTFYMCRASLPYLSRDSAIVNLSSMAGHRGSHGHAHYAASKGAVSSLSKSLARELAPTTRVNLVAPGIIATHMTEALVREQGDALLAATPMQRWGQADEVAGAIAFLCSNLASFITGETLHVNGGLYIV